MSTTPQSFNNAEKARVYSEYFEQGERMWNNFASVAEKHVEAPEKILDLGSGPGEPGCTLAAKFGSPTIISDMAPPMVALEEKRVIAKGLENVECMTLDISDMSALSDDTFDLVTASHCFQFCPDKDKACAEAFRVLKPGGLFVAAVWEEVELMKIAGGIMAHITGVTGPPPPFNPNGPLGLKDPEVFDALLKTAGFEFEEDHNMLDNYPAIELGPLDGEIGFKMSVLPLWDKIAELSEGPIPDAWEKAAAGWKEIGSKFVNPDGIVTFSGRMRFAICRKKA